MGKSYSGAKTRCPVCLAPLVLAKDRVWWGHSMDSLLAAAFVGPDVSPRHFLLWREHEVVYDELRDVIEEGGGSPYQLTKSVGETSEVNT